MFRSVLLTLCVLGGLAHPLFAQVVTDLGITQAEIDQWVIRAASGPYKSAGDVSTNSPGDWDRIVSEKNTFNAAPGAQRWTPSFTGCWSPNGPRPIPGRAQGENLQAAAFFYLVDGDTTTRDNVKNELLAQAAEASTDFSNGTKWCLTPRIGDAYSWEIALWLEKLINGYSYIRHAIPAGDVTVIDAWFTSAATFFENNVNLGLILRFPNRKTESLPYTTFGAGFSTTDCEDGRNARVTYVTGSNVNGPSWRGFHEGWNNRIMRHITVAGLVGLLTDNATFKAEAARFYKEWLTYAVWPNGTDQDMHRHVFTFPDLAFHYSSTSVATMANMAEAFARKGDTSLIEYSTTDGNCAGDEDTSSAGNFGTGPKTLKTAMLHIARMVDGTNIFYVPGHAGDPDWQINSVDPLLGQARNHDTYFTIPNLYLKDAEITAIYTRQAAGAPAYPSNPATGGWGPWEGVWGTRPGHLFMFGQLETVVDPYGGTPSIPVAPTITPTNPWHLASVTVTLATTSAVPIHYTTDGTTPDQTDTLYTVPFALSTDGDTTVKAVAFDDPTLSTVTTFVYSVDEFVSSTTFRGAQLSPTQTGTFTAQFTFEPNQNNQVGVIALGNVVPESHADMATILALQVDGTIGARNGGVYTADNVLAYSAGTTYAVDMVVDLAAHTYDVTVTPFGSGPTVIADDYAFRTEQASLAEIGILSAWTDAGNTTTITLVSLSDPGGPPATVSVVTTLAAFEPPRVQTGLFTLTRDTTSGALVVECSITGTATSGVDYTALACPYTIPNGELTLDIPVTTINDDNLDDGETIIFTINADAAYNIGTASVTMTVADRENAIARSRLGGFVGTFGAQ